MKYCKYCSTVQRMLWNCNLCTWRCVSVEAFLHRFFTPVFVWSTCTHTHQIRKRARERAQGKYQLTNDVNSSAPHNCLILRSNLCLTNAHILLFRCVYGHTVGMKSGMKLYHTAKMMNVVGSNWRMHVSNFHCNAFNISEMMKEQEKRRGNEIREEEKKKLYQTIYLVYKKPAQPEKTYWEKLRSHTHTFWIQQNTRNMLTFYFGVSASEAEGSLYIPFRIHNNIYTCYSHLFLLFSYSFESFNVSQLFFFLSAYANLILVRLSIVIDMFIIQFCSFFFQLQVLIQFICIKCYNMRFPCWMLKYKRCAVF